MNELRRLRDIVHIFILKYFKVNFISFVLYVAARLH